MIDINDIKPLEHMIFNLRLFFSPVALAALLLLLGTWFCRQRRKKLEVALSSLSPDQEATEKLLNLEDMGLIKQGEIKKHYVLLSEIFRKYLERRFGFAAVECTSEEIAHELASLHVMEDLQNRIYVFLVNMDLVKFAQADCSAHEAMAETDRIKRFVADREQQNPTRSEKEHVAV